MDTNTIAPTCLLVTDGRQVVSDELPVLIDALIPGYSGMDDKTALYERSQYAADAIGAAQTHLAENHVFDDTPTDEQLTALLRDKIVPLPFALPAPTGIDSAGRTVS